MDKQYILDQMKNEICNELGIELNGDTSSRICGSIGGEITKRLIKIAEDLMQQEEQNKQ